MNQKCDDVLRRMLKTPPAPRRPVGKRRRKVDDERLIEEIKRNPDKLDKLARLGQNDPTDKN